MRILHIAPLTQVITECAPGGAEQLCSSLAAAQCAAGHEVSVVAVTGSVFPPGVHVLDAGIAPGLIVPIDTSGMTLELTQHLHFDRREREAAAADSVDRVLESLVEDGGAPDIIHNHAFDEAFLFPERELLPCVHTLHCLPVAPWLVDRLQRIPQRDAESKYVAVSRSAAKRWSDAAGVRLGFIYNGLELDQIPFSDQSEDALGWVGRISPEKGLHTAIDYIETNPSLRLRVFGRVYDERYFEERIKARLANPQLDYRGYLRREELFEELGKLRAVLSPIEFEEPFGLTLIEAMATGTPVVSFARGAAKEIVVEGENGILIEHAFEIASAVQSALRIDRAGCRRSVVDRFSVEQMERDYLALYRRISGAS